MTKPTTLLLLASVVMLASFNNCSKVDFATVASEGVSKTGTPVDLPPTTVIEEAIKDCADAAAAGKLLQTTVSVKFDDTRAETGLQKICSATTQENFEVFTNNGHGNRLAARYEQKRTVSLPAGAILCGVELDNDLASFKYDDVIFLTLNNYVLATNLKGSLNRLATDSVQLSSSQDVNLYKYNWLQLRGAQFTNDADDYCLGAEEGMGACSWPITEQPGKINVGWDPKLLIAMGLAASNPEVQEFKFVVTGDDDANLDCYHEELAFNTKVNYFIK